ncbi:hypothetical protein SOASR029_30920 [Budvicia aquatica]|nr:hypothetical protein SOASR029_30920 [Budvicia aquatica]
MGYKTISSMEGAAITSDGRLMKLVKTIKDDRTLRLDLLPNILILNDFLIKIIETSEKIRLII